MQISVVSHREPEPLDLSAFERLAGFVLEREEAPDAIELSIAVVALDEMAELNSRFRGKEGPTDVLSFGCDDPCAVVGPDEPVTLGDVVIALRWLSPKPSSTDILSRRSSTCCSFTVCCICSATSTKPTRTPLRCRLERGSCFRRGRPRRSVCR